MIDPNRMSAESSGDALPAGDERRPYRKPSFRSEQVFETMALVCGKMSTTQSSCAHQMSAS
jgi:hypothetical protein